MAVAMPPLRNVPKLSKITLEDLGVTIYQKFIHCPAKSEYWVKELVDCLATNLELGVHNDLDLVLWRRLSQDWESGVSSKDHIRALIPGLPGPHTRAVDFTSCKMIADNTKKGRNRKLRDGIFISALCCRPIHHEEYVFITGSEMSKS